MRDEFERRIRPWLPTIITASRIALTPVVAYLWTNYFVWTGVAVFLFAVWTDWLDGAVARALDAKSDLGAFADGLADKVMILPLLWVGWKYYAPALTWWGISAGWVFIAIAAIEVLLVVIRLPRLFDPSVNVHAGVAGKWKFVFQVIVVLEGVGALGTSPNAELAPVAVAFGLMSFFQHVMNFRK